MRKFIFRLIAMLAVSLVGLTVLGALTYGKTNLLVVENNANVNICVFPYPNQKIVVVSQSKLKKRFKVKGDGDFTVKICEQEDILARNGYFTPTFPARHSFLVTKNLDVTYDWEGMVW